MPPDKFSATWVSHTSISEYLKCPRAYFLKNVYKDPRTKHKIQMMSPALALGQAVHEVLESLSVIPTDQRFSRSLLSRFDEVWGKVSGKRGGFFSDSLETTYKERGKAMLERVMKNPGPLTRLAVKIKQDLPYFWLSEEENIILCGKIDWLEYFPETDSVNIIDFKTSKNEENESSLQLPIYYLLVHHCQHRKVDKASYWYLELDKIQDKELPDLFESNEQILQIAKKIKLSRTLNVMKCPEGEGGCRHCQPMETILRGEAEFVGENEFRQDIYIMKRKGEVERESDVL